MLDVDMVCANCFYSQETADKEVAYGRTSAGQLIEVDGIFWPYCYCYAEPVAKLVSEYVIDGSCPNVLADPYYYKCGRGRWWKEGKWVLWLDREEE